MRMLAGVRELNREAWTLSRSAAAACRNPACLCRIASNFSGKRLPTQSVETRVHALRTMSFSLILTHPGGSHKDEFLACCLLIAETGAPLVRREPTQADLDDPAVAVVDVGHEHAPERGNFDHHQFPRESEPLCALSLVLMQLGLYDDAREFCEWLEPAEWFDTRGPVETARWLGVPRETLVKLNSPVDITFLRRFAGVSQLEPGDTLWEVMRWIGADMIGYLRTLRGRLDEIAREHSIWELATPTETFRVLFMPRAESMSDEPSAGLARFADSLNVEIAGLVYPDRRGTGFGLSRHKDHPRLDFTRIDGCPDVHFAHARGFVAKTSSSDPQRLRELLAMSWV
jgi:hypothetical protein